MESRLDPTRSEGDASLSFDTALVVDDEAPLRHMLQLLLRREGFAVTEAPDAESALGILGNLDVDVDVVLCDVRMPGMGGLEFVDWARTHRPDLTVIVMSAFGSVELAVDALKRGACDYISKPFKQDEVLLTLRKAQERQRLRREVATLRACLDGSAHLGPMLIRSQAMQQVAHVVRKVAQYKTTTLVLGESGVGKELVARALAELGPRASAPFVAVNCGAIPGALLESELFGHARGAFTDASADRRGLFEEANGGTLFLDEIGELPVSLQVKLLRVLQEEQVRRVGEGRSRRVDVRVVAATSRDLTAMVEAGTFRQDLYYRLNVMPIEIPPLRDRTDDLVPLVEHFVITTNARLGTNIAGMTPEAWRRLLSYGWPGNVRELENTIEHAAVMAEGDTIDVEHLPDRVREERPRVDGGLVVRIAPDDLSVKRAGRILERQLIACALEQTGGNRTHAARRLDLSHRALLYKIKEFGLC